VPPFVERTPSSSSFIEVLDRVLDKGVVIDGWGRVSLIGIELMNVDGWVVIASIETYLRYADSLGLNPRVDATARPWGALAHP
jgi:hypothetical protein